MKNLLIFGLFLLSCAVVSADINPGYFVGVYTQTYSNGNGPCVVFILDPSNGVYVNTTLGIPCASNQISSYYTNLIAVDDESQFLFISLGDKNQTIFKIFLSGEQTGYAVGWSTIQYAPGGELRNLYFDNEQRKLYGIFKTRFFKATPMVVIDPLYDTITTGADITTFLALGDFGSAYSVDYGTGNSFWNLRQYNLASGQYTQKSFVGLNNTAPGYNSIVGWCYSKVSKLLFAQMIYYWNIRVEPKDTMLVMVEPWTAQAAIVANLTTPNSKFVKDIVPLTGFCGSNSTYIYFSTKDTSSGKFVVTLMSIDTLEYVNYDFDLKSIVGYPVKLRGLAYMGYPSNPIGLFKSAAYVHKPVYK